ncbi:hypothetical protein IFM89_010244 [Coptis chinensis]|uniref:NAC domain-containing protein n=1 Tax=Coptis chinensis TaxID=261450 RepID=A0A835IQS1_9MAGN|nr:hypothetical protein IFM89_010244 [Coptis chinensis]
MQIDLRSSELSSHKKFLHDESNCNREVEAKLCICFDFDYGSKRSKMRAPNGMKSGWVMHEFRLENLHMPPKEEWVLCRVFHKGKEDLSSKKCLEYDIDDAIIERSSSKEQGNRSSKQRLSTPKKDANEVVVAVWKKACGGKYHRASLVAAAFNKGAGESRTFLKFLSSAFEIPSGENDGNLGLPGRVFRQRLPEWTTNVEYYNCKEYPRLNDALHYNKTNFGPEVDKVCKALEMLTCEVLETPGQSITYRRGRGIPAHVKYVDGGQEFYRKRGTEKNVSDAHVRAYLFGLIYPTLPRAEQVFARYAIREKRTIMIGSTRPDHDIGDHYGRE